MLDWCQYSDENAGDDDEEFTISFKWEMIEEKYKMPESSAGVELSLFRVQ